MPKRIGSADIAAIYADPARAEAEARDEIAKAQAMIKSITGNPFVQGVGLASMVQSAHVQEQNGKFKLERALFAQRQGAAAAAPIAFGLGARGLAVAAVVGVLLVLWVLA